MSKVIADISMSLDGFVTGDGADEQHGLGDAPELHTWVMQQDAVDTEILEQSTAQSGAVVMVRRLFDVVNGPDGWNEEMGYGADQTGTPPFFVVTHSPPQEVRLQREPARRWNRASSTSCACTLPRCCSVAAHRASNRRRQMYRQRDVRPSRNAVHLSPGLLVEVPHPWSMSSVSSDLGSDRMRPVPPRWWSRCS